MLQLRRSLASTSFGLLLFLLGGPIGTPVMAQYSVEFDVLVETADPSPDGNGVFSNEIGPPVLNDAGQVAFLAKLLATRDAGPLDDLGVYRADATSVQTLVRGGDPSAAGNQLDLTLLQLGTPLIQPIFSAATRSQFALDQSGRLVFFAVDDQNHDAIYRSDSQKLNVIMQTGENTAFGTNVNVAQVVTTFLSNDQGQLGFVVTANNEFFQVLNTDDSSPAILQTGQLLADGRNLAAFRNSALNNNGQMILRLNTSNDSFGYYLADAVGTTKILHTGEPAPDGLGSFTINVVTTPNINDAGQAVMQAFVDDISEDYTGLFFFDGTALSELIRAGDPTFGGAFNAVVSTPRLNNNGAIAYRMFSGGQSIARLVLRRGPSETLVISEGDLLGDPINLAVDTLRGMVLNDQDQLLFRARLRDGGLAVEALLLFDPDHGVALVATHGQPFQGDTLVAFTTTVPFSGLEANANWKNAENGFNNNGQVAFTYLLANGTAGVAIAEVTFATIDELFSDGFESR